MVEIPFQLTMPILFSLIIYWAIKLRNEAASFFLFVSALLILVFFGNSLGILLGSMFSDIRAALGVIPVLNMFIYRWLHYPSYYFLAL